MVNPSLLLGPGDERIGSMREVVSFLAGDSKAIGRTPPIEPTAAEQAKYLWYFDGKQAREELGFAPREASATVFDTIEYVRQHPMGNGAFTKKT